jgi:co-chaperonin GroES (HSP10)
MRIRATQDNVIVRIVPEPDQTKSGLFLPQNRQAITNGTKRAEVIAVGPGYYRDSGHGRFIPTTLKPGQIILVDVHAGQDYRFDISVPRHNKKVEWGDKHGEFRIIREEEALALVEETD